jgi:hypothetical protein
MNSPLFPLHRSFWLKLSIFDYKKVKWRARDGAAETWTNNSFTQASEASDDTEKFGSDNAQPLKQ